MSATGIARTKTRLQEKVKQQELWTARARDGHNSTRVTTNENSNVQNVPPPQRLVKHESMQFRPCRSSTSAIIATPPPPPTRAMTRKPIPALQPTPRDIAAITDFNSSITSTPRARLERKSSSRASTSSYGLTARERELRMHEKVSNWQVHMEGLRQKRHARSIASDRPRVHTPEFEHRFPHSDRFSYLNSNENPEMDRFSHLHHRMAMSEISLLEITSHIRGNLSAIRQSISRISPVATLNTPPSPSPSSPSSPSSSAMSLDRPVAITE